MTRTFALALMLAACGATQAAGICSSELLAATAVQLKHDPSHTRMQQCAALPGSPGKALMVFGYRNDGNTDEAYDQEGDFDLDVVIADADGKMERYFRHADLLEYTDPNQFAGFSIDQAGYQLAPGVRAFAVRANNLIHTRIVDMRGERLFLYVDTGKELRPVLSWLPMNSFEGQWIDCVGGSTTLVRTLAPARTTTRGWRDLVVTTRKTVAVSRRKGEDDCADRNGKPVVSRHLLRYDGNQYVIPAALK